MNLKYYRYPVNEMNVNRDMSKSSKELIVPINVNEEQKLI
jgi:hypothetical protein